MNPTCGFYTLGCKVNQYETQGIREGLISSGYRERAPGEPCDVYVINTCTVTAKADKESRRLIRKCHRRNPAALVIVTGCYAELNEREIRTIPGGHMVIKNRDKHKIARVAASKRPPSFFAGALSRKRHFPFAISGFKDRTKAFLKIQDGCNIFCSYCKVPLVRGRSRSRDAESVIEEAGRLIEAGFREIVLTGICLGAWGEDLSPKSSLKELLLRLAGLKGHFRIRLSSIEPKYVTEGLMAVMKTGSRICPHLHVPFQSGDNEILGRMNRPYSAQIYEDIVKTARSAVPDISITTDMMTGFPGEGDRHFKNTLDFIGSIRPSRIHVFPYSRRDGTAAALFKKETPAGVIKARLGMMEELARDMSYGYRKDFLNKKTEVLIEGARDAATGLLKGYDDKYIRVLIKGGDELMYKLAPVILDKVERERTIGSLLKITP